MTIRIMDYVQTILMPAKIKHQFLQVMYTYVFRFTGYLIR